MKLPITLSVMVLLLLGWFRPMEVGAQIGPTGAEPGTSPTFLERAEPFVGIDGFSSGFFPRARLDDVGALQSRNKVDRVGAAVIGGVVGGLGGWLLHETLKKELYSCERPGRLVNDCGNYEGPLILTILGGAVAGALIAIRIADDAEVRVFPSARSREGGVLRPAIGLAVRLGP